MTATSFIAPTSDIDRQKARIKIAREITITGEQHNNLFNHVIERVMFGNQIRDWMCDRFEHIDKEVAGFIKLQKDDIKRQMDNRKGKGSKPVDFNLQLVAMQLHEATTYLMEVMSPDIGLYSAVAPPDSQEVAQAFAALLNKQDQTFQHYRNLAKAFFSALKYNFGGVLIEWKQRKGFKIENTAAGGIELNDDIIIEGNSVQHIDPYNFIYDVSVLPPDLNKNGEFFATVDVINDFRIRKMLKDELVFNMDEKYLKEGNTPTIGTSFYKEKPDIRYDGLSETPSEDWVKVLSGGLVESGNVKGVEVLYYYGWINPKDFGLTKEDKYQIWRFMILRNKRIVHAEQLTNAHNLLPCAFSMPWEDELGLRAKSWGEVLTPLQRFASHEMNVHQRIARKALYGVTIYDSNQIPALDVDDLLGGVIAGNATGQDRDIRKAVYQFNHPPTDRTTMENVKSAIDLMQILLPTNIQRQTASLERATRYQAAATVQGTNRRPHHIAKVMNSQMMNDMRYIEMMNVFQFQSEIKLIDPSSGKEIKVDPRQFRETEMEFAIADGLKGIDRLLIIEGMQEIINSMLQRPDVGREVDIIRLIDYWADMLGDKTDFTSFRIQHPLDGLPPAEKDIAMQAYQAAQQQQQSGGAQ